MICRIDGRWSIMCENKINPALLPDWQTECRQVSDEPSDWTKDCYNIRQTSDYENRANRLYGRTGSGSILDTPGIHKAKLSWVNIWSA